MIWDLMPDAELDQWCLELLRIYAAGVLSTGSVNGVTMQFASRADLEARMVLLNGIRAARSSASCRPAALQSVIVRSRRF